MVVQVRLGHVVHEPAQIVQVVFLAGVAVGRQAAFLAGLEVVAQFVGADPHDAFDLVQRDGVGVLADAHHQRPVHGQGERQTHHEAGALPGPRVDGHRAAQLFDLAGHHVHAHAPAGQLGHLAGGGEAGVEDELLHFVVGQRGVLRHQTPFDGFAAYRVGVDAFAVVGQGDHHLAALAGQLQADVAALFLAGATALLRVLDAVVHGVAQHVLQRRHHALHQGAVQLAFRVDHVEGDTLAHFAGHLPHDAPQPRHQAGERHHAGAHELFLQVGVNALLLQQQGFRVAGAIQQGVLQVQQVRGGLGKLFGDLVQFRILVHFQRVETAVDFAAVHALLVGGHDLCFGLGVEPAQLLVEAHHGGAHLADVEAELADALFHPAAVDGGLAGQVDQRFQHVGADPHHFLGL